MLNRFRAFFAAVFTPPARALLRLGVTPDMVTIVGTLGVSAGALVFFPLGYLSVGVLVITAFVFSDAIDGVMARLSGTSSKWGAFLDSSLDRVGDGAVFGGFVLYFALYGGADADPTSTSARVMTVVALYVLVMIQVTSYVRARAESLEMRANVGIAERADRLVAVLVAAFFSGLGVPYLLEGVIALLALASTVTVCQRMLLVRSQALAPATTAATTDSP